MDGTFEVNKIIHADGLVFPDISDSKESVCNTGDSGSVPELGRSPGEENGNPFQYYCLENSMDIGAWWTAVNGVAVRHD